MGTTLETVKECCTCTMGFIHKTVILDTVKAHFCVEGPGSREFMSIIPAAVITLKNSL